MSPPGRLKGESERASREGSPMSKPRIGWIGIGRMGAVMAQRLARAGYPVTAY
ncbi:MAG TPA: NAD(P)-binding domain-containing protein, partial [Burkholderiales bacterium]|nr:NAD(P)-binding domain-containing protein [Burkholderiales bacterium]